MPIMAKSVRAVGGGVRRGWGLPVAVVGIGMNRKEYNGSFDWGLTFSQVMLVLAVPAGLMVPISWYGIEETPKPAVGLGPYLKLCGKLLQRKAFFYVMLFQFLSNLIASITTTAGDLVKNYWAGVQNLQNQVRPARLLTLTPDPNPNPNPIPYP